MLDAYLLGEAAASRPRMRSAAQALDRAPLRGTPRHADSSQSVGTSATKQLAGKRRCAAASPCLSGGGKQQTPPCDNAANGRARAAGGAWPPPLTAQRKSTQRLHPAPPRGVPRRERAALADVSAAVCKGLQSESVNSPGIRSLQSGGRSKAWGSRAAQSSAGCQRCAGRQEAHAADARAGNPGASGEPSAQGPEAPPSGMLSAARTWPQEYSGAGRGLALQRGAASGAERNASLPRGCVAAISAAHTAGVRAGIAPHVSAPPQADTAHAAAAQLDGAAGVPGPTTEPWCASGLHPRRPTQGAAQEQAGALGDAGFRPRSCSTSGPQREPWSASGPQPRRLAVPTPLPRGAAAALRSAPPAARAEDVGFGAAALAVMLAGADAECSVSLPIVGARRESVYARGSALEVVPGAEGAASGVSAATVAMHMEGKVGYPRVLHQGSCVAVPGAVGGVAAGSLALVAADRSAGPASHFPDKADQVRLVCIQVA